MKYGLGMVVLWLLIVIFFAAIFIPFILIPLRQIAGSLWGG